MYTRQKLAELGKRASDLYRHQSIPLTEAVVKVAQAEPNLTPDHVTRVLENANLITFEEEFKDSDSKHVVFNLADPIEVQRMLDESDPTALNTPDEYLSDPLYPDYDDTVFDRDHAVKESAYTDINPEFEEQQHMTRLRWASDHLASELNSRDSSAQHETAKLASMFKVAAVQAQNSYAPFELISHVVEDEEVFEKVSHIVTVHLPRGLQSEPVGLAPNFNHPLVQQYMRVESLTKEASRLRRGVARLERELDNIITRRKMLGGNL